MKIQTLLKVPPPRRVESKFMVILFIFNMFVHTTYSGVSNHKFHVVKKISQQARHILSKSSEENEFDRREAIYDNHREALCVEFRWLLYFNIKFGCHACTGLHLHRGVLVRL